MSQMLKSLMRLARLNRRMQHVVRAHQLNHHTATLIAKLVEHDLNMPFEYYKLEYSATLSNTKQWGSYQVYAKRCPVILDYSFAEIVSTSPIETNWFASTSLEDPSITEIEIVVVSREHGTLVFDDQEYTLIRVCSVAENNGTYYFLFITSKIPDTLRRVT